MLKKYILGIVMLGIGLTATATNLEQVYQQALAFNPAYLGSQASSLVAKDQIAIDRSSFLPQLSASAGYNYNRDLGSSHYTSEGVGYGVSLSQTIIDFSKFKNMDGSKKVALAAKIKVLASKQDLMTKVSQAYFELADAEMKLRLDEKKKHDQYTVYIEAKKRFLAGQTVRTGMTDANAAYAASMATVIQDQMDIDNKTSIIKQMTGQSASQVSKLKANFPIIQLKKVSLDQLINRARLNNLSIQSDRYTLSAAKSSIAATRAMHLPTLQATAGYNSQRSLTQQNVFPNNSQSGLTAGVNLSFPIFMGGSIISSTTKAQDQYTVTYQQLRNTTQTVYNQVRQSYTVIKHSARLLKRLHSSISLQRQALHNTMISYHAGIQSMQDVLTAQDNLYTQQQAYYTQAYAYLNAYLLLKQSIGNLQFSDIKLINSWLV